MLIADRPDLQIFMLKRHAKTVFAGGMWVFPGGAVDPEDNQIDLQTDVSKSEDPGNLLSESKADSLPFYIAAIRESFEESGILFGFRKNESHLIDFSDHKTRAHFDALRQKLNSQQTNFGDILRHERLTPAFSSLHPVARWITPLGSPKRFDARFFIAAMPSNQTPIHDDGELVKSDWMRPSDILTACEQEKMVLMSPTLRMVRNLAAFKSTQAVLHAVSQDLSYQRVRVDTTHGNLLLPGELGYDKASEDIETGWIRLRPEGT
jgi:8-oxo-dGTP pyrophosphatase MutT (NUDIX family)